MINPKRIHEFNPLTSSEITSDTVFEVEKFTGGESFLLLETGDNLLLESSGKLELENSSTQKWVNYRLPYAELLAIGAKAVIDIGSNTTFSGANFYNIKGGTIFEIVSAISVFSASIAFQMEIKNASGATITINRTSTDTFYELGGTTATFDLSDGEACKLTAVSTTTWAIS